MSSTPTSSTTTTTSPGAVPLENCKQGDLEKLQGMVKAVHVCMMCTVDSSGRLHSRPMAVQHGQLEVLGMDRAQMWFFTYASSHKVHELDAAGHQLNLAFSDPSHNTYVSISGRGYLVRDKAEINKRWHPLLNAWFEHGKDDADVALLRCEVDSAEWWNATSSNTVSRAAAFIKSKWSQATEKLGAHGSTEAGKDAASSTADSKKNPLPDMLAEHRAIKLASSMQEQKEQVREQKTQ